MPERSTHLTHGELDVLFHLQKSQSVGHSVQWPESLAVPEGEQLSLMRKRLLDLRLIRMDDQKIALTRLGELYTNIASSQRSKSYLFLCLALCGLLFAVLAYRLLLAV